MISRKNCQNLTPPILLSRFLTSLQTTHISDITLALTPPIFKIFFISFFKKLLNLKQTNFNYLTTKYFTCKKVTAKDKNTQNIWSMFYSKCPFDVMSKGQS